MPTELECCQRVNQAVALEAAERTRLLAERMELLDRIFQLTLELEGLKVGRALDADRIESETRRGN
jgi:hypothetical protein